MNLHALLWLGLFTTLAGLTFRRSSWGIALYLLTIFAPPGNWWWGDGLLTTISLRWNLVAALILAVGVFLDRRPQAAEADGVSRSVLQLLLLFGLNATIVHFLFADDPIHSWQGLLGVWKIVGLCFLLLSAIRDEFDLKIMMFALMLGALFVGYEVIVNEQGRYEDGRLAAAGLSGGAGGNLLAQAFCLPLLCGGYFVFFGKKAERCLALLCVVFTFEVILRTVTRSVFLALIVSGAWFVIRSKGKVRKYSLAGIVLGVMAFFVISGPEDQARIFGRFATTFVKEGEEREGSSQHRIDLWERAIVMISDHPLGSGFEATFKSDLGFSYIKNIAASKGTGEFARARSVHNGYLDIAGSWGVQGLLLYLCALFVAWRGLCRAISDAHSSGAVQAVFLGRCIEAMLVTQLVASTFMSSLKAEWLIWWIAMAATYVHALPTAGPSGSESQEVDGPLAITPTRDQASSLEYPQ